MMTKAEDRGPRTAHGRALLAPALANLAIGIPAIIPLYLTYWLLTRYAPSDCEAFAPTPPSATNCDYHTLDHAPVVMFLLALTGAVLVLLALRVNVRPHGRGSTRWLAMTPLILVPFLTLLCLART
ncbi:hypothetical protein [Streptomyces lanatus]|uniref:Integral membrane protein n=1 Tax=Streptomyces lanatus TaxID=66900 RepID=A0ABV1Y124_9ACTN|nr:hypothetical protein [Streptomyces lanatus]GHH24241.1 hypothetical protein GCM10018780_74320 [Streptomyces lanatus]